MSKDAFVESAKVWDQRSEITRMAAEFKSEIEKNYTFKKDSVALDFGCGTGLIGLPLAPKVQKMFMLDNSSSMLSVLQDKIKESGLENIIVSNSPLRETTMPGNTVDLIVSFMALHHIDDINALFSDMNFALKNGGSVILGDLLTEDGSFHGDQPVPHNGFDPEELVRILSTNGFNNPRFFQNGVVSKQNQDGSLKQYGKFVLMAEKN